MDSFKKNIVIICSIEIGLKKAILIAQQLNKL